MGEGGRVLNVLGQPVCVGKCVCTWKSAPDHQKILKILITHPEGGGLQYVEKYAKDVDMDEAEEEEEEEEEADDDDDEEEEGEGAAGKMDMDGD